jgi:Domain of unknown function (DUF3459)
MPALSIGYYRPRTVDDDLDDLLVYFRQFNDTTLLIALNLTSQPLVLSFEQGTPGKVLVSTAADRNGERLRTALRFVVMRDSSSNSEDQSTLDSRPVVLSCCCKAHRNNVTAAEFNARWR